MYIVQNVCLQCCAGSYPDAHVFSPIRIGDRPGCDNHCVRKQVTPRLDSNRPVHQLQRFHTLELAQIVRHQRQTLAACMSCDVQIIDADRLAS